MVAGEGDVALGHLHERLGERLDQQVVDAELDAAALEPGIEFPAKLQKRVELDVDGQIDVRDLLLRLGQPARDGLADIGELDLLVRDCPPSAGAACGAAAGAAVGALPTAASMSARTIRPPGPLP